MRKNVIKKENVLCVCVLCVWISRRSEHQKQGYTPHTFILYFLLLTSLVSVPFITWTWMRSWTHTQTHRYVVFIQRQRFGSCVWREKAEVERLNPELLFTLPSSCATRCLHSRALRASHGINDHYGSIRAATRRSLCYTEKPGMKMLVGSHQTEWVKGITLSHPTISDVMTDKQQFRSSESAS